MSIELDIFPLVKHRIRWGDLKKSWQSNLSSKPIDFLYLPPKLKVLGSDISLSDTANIEIGTSYYLELSRPSTLGLITSVNQHNLDEREYLEDYGRNLPEETIQEYVEKWEEVGHYYELTSPGGRPKDELNAMVALACALADETSGRIIVMNNGVFTLGVGVYTPYQFKVAQLIL